MLSPKLPWELANPKWAAELNAALGVPVLAGSQLTSVSLIANKPQSINHLLGRMQQGWILTDNTANASVWRTQPFNSKTLTLESNVNTTISLWVY